MYAQNIPDCHSGCKSKCDKEHTEHEGYEKLEQPHKKKPKSWGQKEASKLHR